MTTPPTTLTLVFCERGSLPVVVTPAIEYDPGVDRRFVEKMAMREWLGGDFARHRYPPGLGKDHLTVWRQVDRCIVGMTNGHGELLSLREEDAEPVCEEIRTDPLRFLPEPDALLHRYLAGNEDIANPEGDPERVKTFANIENVIGIAAERFLRLREFVLREGRFYTPQTYPTQYRVGDRGLCYRDSMRLSIESELVYVEGFALTYVAKVAMLHGWCSDDLGRVVDSTWPNTGIAYYGVSFRPAYVRAKSRVVSRQPARPHDGFSAGRPDRWLGRPERAHGSRRLEAGRERGVMDRPNLFDFATSELSQDAFVCWLASWASPKYRAIDVALHTTATAFLDRLLEIGKGPKPDDYRSIQVRRQWKDIDVLVVVNGDTAIIIEDKTDTRDHSGQLERYKKVVVGEFEANRIAAVYLKTGDQGNYRSVENAGYGCFLRRDFLNVLDSGNRAGVTNDIFADFHGTTQANRGSGPELPERPARRLGPGLESLGGLFPDHPAEAR